MDDARGYPDGTALGGYFRILFDAVPSPVLIVDDDVSILDYNVAGAALLGPERRLQYMRRGGDALHCIHSHDSPGGCGRSEYCADCIVRNSVSEALRSGEVCRRRTMMQLGDAGAGSRKDLMLLVTASPFRYGKRDLVLLVLEDVSELMRLQEMLPICSHCKKIRTGANYWKSVEDYFLEHENLLFSHSICDECREKYYPPPPSRKR